MKCHNFFLLFVASLSGGKQSWGVEKAAQIAGGSYFEMRKQDLLSYRRDLHRWDRILQGFRQGHHFGLLLGQSSGSWRKSSVANFDGVGTRYSMRMVYIYSVRMVNNIGYTLGSQATIPLSDNTYRLRSQTYRLPGARVGLVWSPSSATRFEVATGVHLVRVEKFNIEGEKKLTATARGQSLEVLVDLFYSFNQGVRISYEQHEFKVEDVLGLGLNRGEKPYSVGWIYHLI